MCERAGKRWGRCEASKRICWAPWCSNLVLHAYHWYQMMKSPQQTHCWGTKVCYCNFKQSCIHLLWFGSKTPISGQLSSNFETPHFLTSISCLHFMLLVNNSNVLAQLGLKVPALAWPEVAVAFEIPGQAKAIHRLTAAWPTLALAWATAFNVYANYWLRFTLKDYSMLKKTILGIYTCKGCVFGVKGQMYTPLSTEKETSKT